MNKRVVKKISVLIILSLICSAITVIILNKNLNQNKKIENEVAEINEIDLGNEKILYVDLTKTKKNVFIRRGRR